MRGWTTRRTIIALSEIPENASVADGALPGRVRIGSLLTESNEINTFKNHTLHQKTAWRLITAEPFFDLLFYADIIDATAFLRYNVKVSVF